MRSLLELIAGARVMIARGVTTYVADAASMAGTEERHRASDSDWLLLPSGQGPGRSDSREPALQYDSGSVTLALPLSHSAGRSRHLGASQATPEEIEAARLRWSGVVP